MHSCTRTRTCFLLLVIIVTTTTCERLVAPSGSLLQPVPTDRSRAGDRNDFLSLHHSATRCAIYVSTNGSDAASGTQSAPLRSPESAVLLRRAMAPQCPMATITLMGSSVFYLTAPPITLDHVNDSRTVWQSEDGATLSGGYRLPPACWTPVKQLTGAWSCVIPPGILQEGWGPRSITINGRRAQEARFPDEDPADPYGTQATQWLVISSSHYVGNATFIIGVKRSVVPSWAVDSLWEGARIHIFPTRSWINIVQVSIAPAPPPHLEQGDPGLAYFRVQCPSPSQCTDTSNSATIGPGNRFYIAGAPEALTHGEWVYNRTSRQVTVFSSSNPPQNVVVPRNTSVLRISSPPSSAGTCSMGPIVNGRSPGSALATLPPIPIANCSAACCEQLGCLAIHRDTVHCYLLDRRYEGNFINDSKGGIVADAMRAPVSHASGPHSVTIRGIRFADTDFSYNGYQEGFSLEPTDQGMPRDAAVEVSNVTNVTISACAFTELSGGGVHISNSSSYVTVDGCIFSNLGQTGVTLSGDALTQPTHCVIAQNNITRVGVILASAAGIVASTTSYTTIANNSIQWSSRWGIHVRSQGDAISIGNLVEGNTMSMLAMSTRDMGGLSFIGEGHTGTIVRNNCVRDVIGMDTDWTGQFLRPFYNWGIYLDNWSSNFTVTGNVVRSNVLGGVFVHGGSNNTITNNVLYNSSNASMPLSGSTQWPQGSFGVVFGWMRDSSLVKNNVVTRNIVVGPPQTPLGPVAICLAIQPNFTLFSDGLVVDRNLYYQPGVRLEATPHLTPLGTWASWTSRGYDAHSTLDTDPCFVDPTHGDFRLQQESPALDLGFVPLENPYC